MVNVAAGGSVGALFAQTSITFSTPVTFDSFYSSEPVPLNWSDGVSSGTVNSGYTFGATTIVNDAGVSKINFSGSANFYVLDTIVYTALVSGTPTEFTLTFDETALQNCGCSVLNFYAGFPGDPVFSSNAVILTYPSYNYFGYPFDSSPDVVYENGPISPTPEPGTLLMFGSGILAAVGAARRKLSA